MKAITFIGLVNIFCQAQAQYLTQPQYFPQPTCLSQPSCLPPTQYLSQPSCLTTTQFLSTPPCLTQPSCLPVPQCVPLPSCLPQPPCLPTPQCLPQPPSLPQPPCLSSPPFISTTSCLPQPPSLPQPSCLSQRIPIPILSPLQPILPPPVIPQPIVQPVVTQPVVATTIIDNSVSNALANALQLLIVSNLIENTMRSKTTEIITPIAEVSACGSVVYPFDVITPVQDIISTLPCNPIANPCDFTYDDIINTVCYPEVITSCDIIAPSYPNYCYPSVAYAEFINPNQFTTIAPVIAPYTYETPILAPVATEMLFPQTIPAQMNCNFGFMPSLPCVSVNVEPWSNIADPCSCGNKCFGYF